MNLFMINITIGTPTRSKRYHTSHNRQKDLSNFLQFDKQAPRPRKISASHANKGAEIFATHASKGATVVAISPPSSKTLQLTAWIPSLRILKHSAHMVNWKFFLGGGFGKAFKCWGKLN
jgi:hypothetical protein